MRSGEADASDADDVVELHDQPIVVPANIEHDTVVPDHICRSELRLHVGRPFPLRYFHLALPGGNPPVESPTEPRTGPLLPSDKIGDNVETDDDQEPRLARSNYRNNDMFLELGQGKRELPGGSRAKQRRQACSIGGLPESEEDEEAFRRAGAIYVERQ
jgi:hypothetical protein